MNNQKIYNYIDDNKLNIQKVMNDYTNYIFSIIRNDYINFSDEDIEEIILDVFFTLWNNQSKLDINKKMSSYIAGITKNLIKKKYRDFKIDYNIDDYEENLISSSDIEKILIEVEQKKSIINEIRKFKKIDEEVFLQYYYEEKSVKEIAEIHNISQSRVKMKLFRLRKKLNNILKKRGDV